MKNEDRFSRMKKEIICFVCITFAITFITNGIMYFLGSSTMSTFVAFQMLYPAVGAMITNIVFNKENISKKSMTFCRLYIGATIVMFIIVCITAILKPKLLEGVNTCGIVVMSIGLLIFAFKQPTDIFEKITLEKNKKYILIFSAIFLATKLVPMIPSFIKNEIDIKLLILTIILAPLSIVISSIIFFGEEYGWRVYLQERLMLVLGKKKGVILLGLIWAVWHTPICFMLYTPNQPLIGLLEQIVFCVFIGIFLSYAVMKAKNVWPCIVIHWFNNNLVAAVNNGSFTREASINDLIIMTILVAVIYGPFIFTKEFKDDRRIIDLDNTKTIE